MLCNSELMSSVFRAFTTVMEWYRQASHEKRQACHEKRQASHEKRQVAEVKKIGILQMLPNGLKIVFQNLSDEQVFMFGATNKTLREYKRNELWHRCRCKMVSLFGSVLYKDLEDHEKSMGTLILPANSEWIFRVTVDINRYYSRIELTIIANRLNTEEYKRCMYCLYVFGKTKVVRINWDSHELDDNDLDMFVSRKFREIHEKPNEVMTYVN